MLTRSLPLPVLTFDNKMDHEQLGFKKLKAVKRRAITEGRGLVTAQPLFPERTLPLLVEPSVSGLDPVAWATRNRDFIETSLRKHGGILFRNFNIKTAELFAQFMAATAGELLTYNERSSPRTQVTDHVYTSTDYPAESSIFVQNENSYQRKWPMKIFSFVRLRQSRVEKLRLLTVVGFTPLYRPASGSASGRRTGCMCAILVTASDSHGAQFFKQTIAPSSKIIAAGTGSMRA